MKSREGCQEDEVKRRIVRKMKSRGGCQEDEVKRRMSGR